MRHLGILTVFCVVGLFSARASASCYSDSTYCAAVTGDLDGCIKKRNDCLEHEKRAQDAVKQVAQEAITAQPGSATRYQDRNLLLGVASNYALDPQVRESAAMALRAMDAQDNASVGTTSFGGTTPVYGGFGTSAPISTSADLAAAIQYEVQRLQEARMLQILSGQSWGLTGVLSGD